MGVAVMVLICQCGTNSLAAKNVKNREDTPVLPSSHLCYTKGMIVEKSFSGRRRIWLYYVLSRGFKVQASNGDD